MSARCRALRRLGVTGVWLAAVLTVGAWLGVLLALAPARAGLAQADRTLVALDAQLAAAQATLAPFDVLARPGTLDAVHTLSELAGAAQRTPLLGLLFPAGSLADGQALARQWEDTLRARPPLPALGDARQQVDGWRAAVRALHLRLTWLGVGLGALVTLLCAWFAAGQVALIRLAGETPQKPTREPDVPR